MALIGSAAIAAASFIAENAAAFIIGGAAAAMGGAGAVMAHQQQKANAGAQAAQARYNQKLEEREAAAVEAETLVNAQRQKQASMRLQAAQRAALGKSGAAMDSGTPLALLGATAIDEQIKSQDLLRGGYRGAMQHREQAKMFGYQGRMARASQPSAASLALDLGGSLLGGVSTGLNTAGAVKNLAK